MCCAFLAVLGLGYDVGVQPFVTSDADANANAVTENIEGTVDVFDATVAHTVELTYTEDDYERMLEEYYEEAEKEWVEADIVIDGTVIDSVGIRLKGNSTLMSLSQSGSRPRMADNSGAERAHRMPTDMATDGQAQRVNRGSNPRWGRAGTFPSADGSAQCGRQCRRECGRWRGGGWDGRPADPQQGAMGAMGGMSSASLSEDEPEYLPWLISFDEFVEGRRYQGYQTIAVRAAGSSSLALNEAVSLSLVSSSGNAAAEFSYTMFTINDRPTVTRLLVEDFGDSFGEDLGSDGVLYKALSTGDFSYQGDDQTDYEDDYKQINLVGSQDIQPVIDLLKWIDEASDEEFAENLDDYVDVESFARYVSLQNLLLNFDDMAGPGKNFYLWYDLDTEKFSVITSDLNMTFSGTATQGPYDSTTMGGGGGGQAMGMGEDRQMPDGMELPEGMEMPDDSDRAAGGDDAAGGMGGGMTTGNTLKDRFLATEAFNTVYENAYRELYQEIFADGTATNTVNALAAVLNGMSGADTTTIQSEASSLLTTIETRTTSLATNEVIASAS